MDRKKVVIVGGGFAGVALAGKLSPRYYDVVLIDKNNFHQFPPLFYQVATGGLDTASIAFPLRKMFQKKRNVSFRMAEISSVDMLSKTVSVESGQIGYDYLVLAVGAGNNFFGNVEMEHNAFPMKSISEALALRNNIVESLEKAALETDEVVKSRLLNFVIVGGGPTGVEVAGAIADMRNNMLGLDYPEIKPAMVSITIIDGCDRVLSGLSKASSADAMRYLTDMGIGVRLGLTVSSYDGAVVNLSNGETIESSNVIWAAGVRGNVPQGIPSEIITRGNRIKTDRCNRVEGSDSVFCIGDLSMLCDDSYPNGYPQLGSVAGQQGATLAVNMNLMAAGLDMRPFHYNDKGSMATIGRNRAVADIGRWHLNGFFAWMAWMFVHLMLVAGSKNKIMIFVDWAWSYITFDASLRLLIRPYLRKRC